MTSLCGGDGGAGADAAQLQSGQVAKSKLQGVVGGARRAVGEEGEPESG